MNQTYIAIDNFRVGWMEHRTFNHKKENKSILKSYKLSTMKIGSQWK